MPSVRWSRTIREMVEQVSKEGAAARSRATLVKPWLPSAGRGAHCLLNAGPLVAEKNVFTKGRPGKRQNLGECFVMPWLRQRTAYTGLHRREAVLRPAGPQTPESPAGDERREYASCVRGMHAAPTCNSTRGWKGVPILAPPQLAWPNRVLLLLLLW
jgi:hypothetical protein